MNYKVGDKVKIKSREWYKANKDKYGTVYCGDVLFIESMSKYCGKVLTIDRVFNFNTATYEMLEDPDEFGWNEEMIECLVEPAPDNKISEIILRANKAVTDSFEDGAKFERERLANFVEQWVKEHACDNKYWDDYGEHFNESIFAEDLKNVISGNG